MPTPNNRRIWFLIAILIIVLQGVLVLSLYDRIQDVETILSWILSAGLPTISVLFWILRRNSIWFFIMTNRLRSILNDNSPVWLLSAQWAGDKISPDAYNKVIERFRQSAGNSLEVSVKAINDASHVVFFTPGPTVEISYTRSQSSLFDDDFDDAYVYVRVRNYRVSFRKASRVIKSEIVPIIETISKVLGEEAKYSLTITYDKSHNPFFSFYLAQLPPDVVSQFVVKLDLSENQQKNEVRISETKLAINTQSQIALQNLAIEFLSLDYGLTRRL